MKFSIGYNHDKKILALLDAYRDHIESFYFPIPRPYVGSGRQIPQQSGYVNEIPEILRKCCALNIRSQLLLNATCEGESGLERKFFSRIVAYIRTLRNAGLKSVVVTNPVYISAIKEQVKDIEVEASVNCYVKTVEQAVYLKDLGADVVTIDRDINRNIPLIRDIKDKSGIRIKIMLNEGCLRNCPFRTMHYNFLSHNHRKSRGFIANTFPDKFCVKIYLKNPDKVFSIPFIPPDAVPQYARLADYFKLTTRAMPTARVESCLKAYIDQAFDGNLTEILDCPGLVYFDHIDYAALKKNDYFKKMIRCGGECGKCGFCGALMRDAAVISPGFLNGADRIKESGKARGIYLKALRTAPDKIPVYYKLSGVCFNLKRYRDAIGYLEKVAASGCKAPGMHFLLGSCYEKIGLYKKAIAEFKKEEKLSPDDARINLLLLKCYKRTGRLKRSKEEENRLFLNLKKSRLLDVRHENTITPG
jgi:collagenase-like PrtC family protease